MRREQAFSRAERRAAAWALMVAAAATAAGLILDQGWGHRSAGTHGDGGYERAAPPGVIDARPAL